MKGTVPALPGGAELRDLVDKMGTDLAHSPTAERQAVVATLGPEAAERAIGVVATFHMMNRLLDGVGAPVRMQGRFHAMIHELGFKIDEIPK